MGKFAQSVNNYPRSATSHYGSPVSVTLLLTLGVFLVTLVPAGQLFPDPVSYLPLHSAMEFFAIAVAMMVFAIGFAEVGGRHLPLLVLSFTFFAVAILDFGHMLSYTGMPRFVTPSAPDKAIVFWLAARWTDAVGVMVAAILPWREVVLRLAWRHAILVLLTAWSALIYWLVLYQANWLPSTYIPGKGLTPFKIYNEYALCAVYALAAGMLWLRHRGGDGKDLVWLAAAVWVTGLSEVFFSLYGSFTDTYNLFGHLYKDIAYAMVFYAMFLRRVRAPYEYLRDSQAALQRSNKQLARTQFAVDHSADMFFWFDSEGRILEVNQAACDRLGYAREVLCGQLVGKFDGELDGVAWSQLWQRLLNSGTRRMETNYTANNGERLPMEMSLNHVVFEGEQYACAFVRDISERRAAQQRIEFLAHHDALTGLANRVSLREEFSRACNIAKRNGQSVALLFLDLDHFKVINDSLGHMVGDRLLVAVAQRLRTGVRAGDIVSRTGGDEFSIVLVNMPNREAIVRVAGELFKRLDEVYEIDGHTLTASFSIGISQYPHDGVDFETLLRKADAALYNAKRAGRKAFRFFEDHMNVWAQERLRLETRLRRAHETGGLTLHYQPLIALDGRAVVGAEALLRWQDEELGEVEPARFIPIAEDTGLILSIGAWVLRETCLQARRWQLAGARDFKIAVNLSALQLARKEFIADVQVALDESGLAPHDLELEFTETVLIQDSETLIETLDILSRLGVRLSIDDYGTGYSSLSYLKRFAVNSLKIDRSFVCGMTRDTGDAMIVRSTIDLAHNLGLQVIAEGVESGEIQSMLTGLGCDFGQGFHLGRPIAAREFSRWFDGAAAGARH